jgi:hypothetical protein
MARRWATDANREITGNTMRHFISVRRPDRHSVVSLNLAKPEILAK